MKLYFVAGKEGGRRGWKKEVKSATKTEREMSYFSTLPAGDHGNAMPGHWYSCCCCSHSSLLLRIIIIISDGHRSRACARRCPPSTRLCRFHFIIVITLCHNLFCPHISHVHMMREEKALLLCNFCAKNGANFPGPALQYSYFPLSSVRQIAFMAFDKFSIIDRFDGPGSNRSSLKR